MKVVKMVYWAGITGTLTSVSTLATPLDITFTGGTPAPGNSAFFGQDFQYEDNIPYASGVGSINLAGVNSIQVTWNAPDGFIYVVTPPPAAVGSLNLWFEASYGSGNEASSLGSITASSLSVDTIYGTLAMNGGGSIVNQPQTGALTLTARGQIAPGSAPVAFNSITLALDFSGIGAGILSQTDLDNLAGNFGSLFGVEEFGVPNPNIPNPGQLITLEPLPTGTTPDKCSTLGLAGLGFVGLFLFGRKCLSTLNV